VQISRVDNLQDVSNVPTVEDVQAIETETQALRNETASAQTTLKQLRAELISLSSELTIEQLTDGITKFEEVKAQLLDRLEPLRSGTAKPVTKEERDVVNTEFKRWNRCADRRRKIVKEIWGVIQDGMGNSDGVNLVSLKVLLYHSLLSRGFLMLFKEQFGI
jgi:26S proteasome regulatory subunit (ATPase 3-interacting protein)